MIDGAWRGRDTGIPLLAARDDIAKMKGPSDMPGPITYQLEFSLGLRQGLPLLASSILLLSLLPILLSSRGLPRGEARGDFKG